MSTNQPTPEQLAALIAFANKHGKEWKDRLLDGWRHSDYPGALQQVRNQLGPEWLATFELPEEEVPVPPASPEELRAYLEVSRDRAYLEVSREKIDFLKSQLNLLRLKNHQMEHFQKAYTEWMDKIEWARKSKGMKQTRFLGLHLGDALRNYIRELEEKVEYQDQVIEQRNGECTRLHKALEAQAIPDDKLVQAVEAAIAKASSAYTVIGYEVAADLMKALREVRGES